MHIKFCGGVLLGTALSAGLGGCASSSTANQSTMEMAESKGAPIAISDLPQAVVQGVQKEMPGAVLTKARK